MTEEGARLDRLATDLKLAVQSAAGAREDANLVAQFDAMTTELNNAARSISGSLSVVLDPSELPVPEDTRATIGERREWVATQLAKIRNKVADDPAQAKQGKTWADTRRALQALTDYLETARDVAYNELLDQYKGDDQQVLEAATPGTPDLAAYRTAVDQFQACSETEPQTLEQVQHATEIGRRLVELRERVESASVPAEFRDQWRAVRSEGLALSDLTPQFSAWLTTQGLSKSVVVVLQSR